MQLPFAFLGRVSTEDNQDPQASHDWQYDKAQRHIARYDGKIVCEYFDIGVSRRIPWSRRPEASRLLADLENPRRGWADVVIGEHQRAFQGSQYEAVAARLKHYGVGLWIAGVADGAMDPENPTHEIMMMINGQMSKAERRVVQQRVKDSMRSIAASGDGRHLGGRPPYGYKIVDAGPHPNPAKARDGKRLTRLERDDATAPAVRMIFERWLDGRSYGEIAQALDDLGHPSPSTNDRERNPHRPGGPWNKGAVRAIITNPRYTGHQVWGRQPASYELIDPFNPAEGDEKVQRRSLEATWVRSKDVAHEPLITEEEFQAAQARLRPMGPRATRRERPSKYGYVLKSRITCSACQRRMEGSQNGGYLHYRCRLVNSTSSNRRTDHPRSIYVREDRVLAGLDQWMGEAFTQEHLDGTVRDLLSASEAVGESQEVATLRAEIRTATVRLERYKAALAADDEDDLAVVVQWIKEASTRRAAAEHRLNVLLNRDALDEPTLRTMIAMVPDMPTLLSLATPEERTALYRAMDLRLTYDAAVKTIHVEADVAALTWGLQECPRGDLNLHKGGFDR